MATHGKAREETIKALQTRTPFKRSGFGMWARIGPVNVSAPDAYLRAYAASAPAYDGIAYTVVSYSTVIAWVERDGSVHHNNTKYSVTTTHHQHLSRVYL